MNSLIIFVVVLALASATPQFGTKQARGGTRPASQYNRPAAPRAVAPSPRINRGAGSNQVVSIRSQTDEVNPDGSYSYSIELDDGTSAQESGSVKNPTPEGGELVSIGSYSYIAPDGQTITLKYVADGEGFKAEGAHLPIAPPIPEAIQRALAYIASQQG